MRDTANEPRQRASRIDRRAAGFSLAELLVVIAIIAVIVLVMLPSFGTFARSWRARSNADGMLAVLKGAHQMAITTHQNITVTFNPDPANTYTYYHPIQKKTLTVKMPSQTKITTNPTATFAPVMNVNGSITNSSAPSISAPTSNFVRVATIIDGNRTDRYTFGFSAAGQISYTVTH
jgi:prepilin-type N-terminal cleavage/methylation domain-containing protein